jgi:hypothetical protein
MMFTSRQLMVVLFWSVDLLCDQMIIGMHNCNASDGVECRAGVLKDPKQP